MRGRLITIEGIDGSGKGTQSKLLLSNLLNLSIPAKLYSFPSYAETFFGKEIGAYLRGEYGTIKEVHPKLASILFAGDRHEIKPQIEADLGRGITVICDRYVDSNIAHQCAKLPRNEQAAFEQWLEELEYGVFSMPKPDLVLLLNLPPTVARMMVLNKDARAYTQDKEDIHERAQDYMEDVFNFYTRMSAVKGWVKIDCLLDDRPMTIAEIGESVKAQVLRMER